MATELFKPKIWFHSHVVSGDMTQAALDYGGEPQDVTTFSDGTRTNKGGLKIVSFESSGFFQAGTEPDLIDPLLFANLNTTKPLTIGPTNSGAGGQPGYTFKVLENSYQPIEGAVGDMLRINLSCASAGDLIRGAMVLNSTGLTSTGSGVARQSGSVSATKRVYASMHVTAASGTDPTLDVTIDSDDNSDMTTPTNRLTFAQVVGVGSEGPISAAGTITDEWWRVEYAITGTDPSFDVAILLGIL